MFVLQYLKTKVEVVERMCKKILLPEIKHLGAKDCVTGSCHLLQTPDGVNILVDCGKAYGNDPEIPSDLYDITPVFADEATGRRLQIDGTFFTGKGS